MKNKETRYLNIADVELRAETTTEGVTVMSGYAARFNSWSEDLGGFRERIRPGAFAKALMTSDVRALYNHDSNNLPLGRTPKTLRLSEDTKGLRFEADLPDTQFAKDLTISIQRKDITGNSFSFTVEDAGDEWREKDGITSRTINEVKELFDIGPVVFPAYDSPKVQVSKRSLEKLEQHKSSVTAGGDNNQGVTAHDEQRNLQIDILTLEYAEDLQNG